MKFTPGTGLSRFHRSLALVGMFAMLASLVLYPAPRTFAAITYTVVTAARPDGWGPANVRTDGSVAITTTQPRGTAPNNLGSLEYNTTSSNGKADYVKYWGVVPGRTLGSINALSFDVYRDALSNTSQHFLPALRLSYAQNVGGITQTGYLIWEDVYNGGSVNTAVPTNQWLTKDIASGYFWMRAFGPSRTVERYDVTLAQWASGGDFSSPGVTAHMLSANTSITGIEVGVGSGWANTFKGYVDQVALGFGADTVSANFEPVVQCTVDCYVNGTTGSDINGGTSTTDAKKTIQAGLDQVSANGTVHVASGTYTQALTIAKPLTLEGAQHGVLAKGRTGGESIVKLSVNQTPLTINASNVNVNGFTFDVSTQNTPWAITALNLPTYTNLHILYNLFTGNPNTGDPNQDAGGMYLQNTQATLIEGNFFDRSGSHGVFMAGSSVSTIYRNNDSLRNYLSNFSNQVGPHINTVMVNNRSVEDSPIIFATTGMTITNNTFTGSPNNSSRVYLGGGDNNIVVDDNTFIDMRAQGVQVFNAGFGYGGNSNITVTRNDFPTNVANQLATSGPYTLIDLRNVGGTSLVDGNIITLTGTFATGTTGVNAISVRGSGTGPTTITNNEVDGGDLPSTGAVPNTGVLIRSNSANGVLDTPGITVTNNILENLGNGITVYDYVANTFGGLSNAVALKVNANSIASNTANGLITGAGDAQVNAERNWWNSYTGPTAAGNPTGTGDTVVGNVDYQPWLCRSVDTQPGVVGFQPSSSVSPCTPPSPACTVNCYVNGTTGDDFNGGSTPDDPKKTIGAGLTQVSAGGTVNIASGTYTGTLVITKSVTLQGAATDQTIIQGTGCNTTGISMPGNPSNVTIADLTVRGFGAGITPGETNSNTITNIVIEDVATINNCAQGIFSQAGVINGLRVTRVNASNNGFNNPQNNGRGIWIINGDKNNVTIEDGTFNNNQLTGIDFGDGDVTGLRITGNTVTGNGDAGISVLGMEGPDANLIDGNTVINNARFGIEVKASTGTGATSGPGSVVVSNNTVRRTTAVNDPRDYAAITVIRRSQNVAFNQDQPSGAVVTNNIIGGYRNTNGGAFGIVIEGTNNLVTSNTISNTNVGLQVQGGVTQNQQGTDGFDRGSAAAGAAIAHYNVISGNTIGARAVGNVTSFNAENNWWGSNDNPASPTTDGDPVMGTLDANPWLFNTITASESRIDPSGTITVKADLRTANSAGQDPGGTVPSGTTVKLELVGGTNTTTILMDGVAQSTFTVRSTEGTQQACATVPATTGAPECITFLVETLRGLQIGDNTIVEGNTATKVITFPVTLASTSSLTATVNYATADDTATAGTDYVATSGTLTFAPGQTTKVISVTVNADTALEADEQFFVNLSGAVNATIGDAQAIGTITTDDDPTISINNITVIEANTGTKAATFQLTLSQASFRSIAVNYATSNGTATSPTDYTAASGTVIFAAGETQQTVTVQVSGDIIDELDETFFVNLSNPTFASIATTRGRAIIVDNEGTPRIAIGDISVAEGNSGTTNFSFPVTLTGPSDRPITVQFATANGTATAGSDYNAASGTVTFTPGQTTQTISVAVRGDTLDEPNETFVVNLATPTNALINDAQGQATILTDDGPNITITDVSVVEGNTGTKNARFLVRLSSASTINVTVNYTTINSTASSPSDYTAKSASLTFTPGQTELPIDVAVVGDVIDELDEAFFVNLTSSTNSTIVDTEGLATIVDNEGTPLIAIGDVSIAEGNSGTSFATFPVTLSGASDRTITVQFATADNTAVAGTDYTATSGTVTFAPGLTTQSITVELRGDTTDEPNETFFVNLTSPTNAKFGDAQAVGTLTSDDLQNISISDVSVIEGNTGSKVARFIVSLSSASTQAVTVNFATANNQATAGSDYTARNGTLTFQPGVTQLPIDIAITGDVVDELDEAYFINLTAPTNATITKARGVGTIVDNEGTPRMTITDVQMMEKNTGTDNVTFFVTLSGTSDRTITVNYATADDTATAGVDYNAVSGTLTFAPGETSKTIVVALRGDTLDEPNESFVVNLTSPVRAVLDDAQGRGTIIDND